MAVALRNRAKGLAKIKQLVVTEFHSEVIAGMENRLGSISTIVRMGPLARAWSERREYDRRVQPHRRLGKGRSATALATDISLALWATGAGLLIANPMMLVGNDVHARLRRLAIGPSAQLQDFLEVLETNQA